MASRPTVGPQQRIDVGGGTAAANETTVAVSDTNPLEIVAGWNDYRESIPGDSIVRSGFAVTLDGGATWTDRLVRPPDPYKSDSEADPFTAADPRTGALWAGAISFSGSGALYVAPAKSFDVAIATGTNGTTGLELPLSEGSRYYLVAGRNACGFGPK